MSFDDRVVYLAIGVVIGFFCGYLTRTLREIKEEIHEVDDILKETNTRDEQGFFSMSRATVNNVALFFVVLLAFTASIQSQLASNKLDDTQAQYKVTQMQLGKVVACNRDILGSALDALNTRSAFSRTQASSNLTLQKANAQLFNDLLHRPPYSSKHLLQSVKNYTAALNLFVKAGTKSQRISVIVQYPSADELVDCVNKSK